MTIETTQSAVTKQSVKSRLKAMGPMPVLALLFMLTLLLAIGFMTYGTRGNYNFIIGFRLPKLLGLLLVAYAIAVSTVLFQTITHNQILTPAIMGFDALYGLIQTVLVFTLGTLGAASFDDRLLFLLETAAMVGFCLILFQLMFSGALKSLHMMMLFGLVLGGLFRALAGFLKRLIDPNAFVVLQDRYFASFNSINSHLLLISALAILGASLMIYRVFASLDPMLLGRDPAISLGIDHRGLTRHVLIAIAIMVSVSTALVGPVTFFGLLVASLARLIMPGFRHRHIMPAAVLLAMITLLGGQLLLERVLAFDTALAIIVEFAGGLVFLGLAMRAKG